MTGPVPHEFLNRGPDVVAPELLNKVLATAVGAGRIVEVEAYDRADPASHSFRGPTPARSTMFGPAGRLYVYRSYGVHWCANVVVAPIGHGAAVLIRAVAPLTGIDGMWARRPAARRERELASGPGRLTAALGIDGGHDGVDLSDPASPVRLIDDGVAPPPTPVVTTRIGITKAVEVPWRFLVPGDPNVSRGRPAGRR